jgi:hypothetical protein
MSLSRVSRWRTGRCSVSLRGAGALLRPAALLLSLALGACSSTAPTTQWVSWKPALFAGPTGGLPPAAGERPQVEIEGDGLEGQRPPRKSSETEPDDPTEPFSPNYGAVPEPAPAHEQLAAATPI